MGSWLKKACRHLERERGLPGAQWPIRGPEKIGRLPPLSGTLQEACSCGEESMAPDLASCHLPGAEWGVGCGDLRPLCALLAPLPSSVPVGRTVSSGARLIHEGRTPTLASLSGALVPPPPPPASRCVPGRPVLTSRHTGSHHGAAGLGHCAWGAVGGRALMSPWAGAARLALLSLLVPAAASGSPRAAPAAAKAGRHRGGRGPGERGGGGAGVRPAPSVPVYLLSLTKVRQTKVTGLGPVRKTSSFKSE
jgi:hypothetical protein